MIVMKNCLKFKRNKWEAIIHKGNLNVLKYNMKNNNLF